MTRNQGEDPLGLHGTDPGKSSRLRIPGRICKTKRPGTKSGLAARNAL